MTDSLPKDDRVANLRVHASAWGVTADIPDDEVFNETAMARECARAANDIEDLRRSLRREENARKVLADENQRLIAKWKSTFEKGAILP